MNKMSFIFFPQILVTIGRKAYGYGRIDDTAFGNKRGRKEIEE